MAMEEKSLAKIGERFVIVGFGWVGQANAIALHVLGFDVLYFDPAEPPRHYTEYQSAYNAIKKLTDVAEADSENTWYVVCVGDRVSDDGIQDIENIKRALESLKNVKGGIILRSTILPDLLKTLPFDYYMPEFLHEKKAVEECLAPYLFVIGSRSKVRKEPRVFKIWRDQARKDFDGSPEEASFIKYLSNLWNSTRIAFVNEFGDALGRPDSKKGLEKINDVIDFLFDGKDYLRYGRSFGGHCLPKDTRAFARWYGEKMNGLPLLSGVYASNTQHRNLEQEYPLMPEWYSEWPERHISGMRALSELWFAIRKNVRNPWLFLKRIFSRKSN